MSRVLHLSVVVTFFVCAGWLASAEETQPEQEKLVSGMSIVGNDEAPKSLVIVPWKSSGMSGVLDVSRVLGDGRKPVDREVFIRELDYYEIRSGAGTAN